MLFCMAVSASASASHKAADLRERVLHKASEFASGQLNDPKKAKEIENLSHAAVSDSVAFQRVYELGRGLFHQGRQAAAFDLMRNILLEVEDAPLSDHNSSRLRLKCYLLLGAASDELGMHNLGMDFYMKGLREAEKTGNKRMTSSFYNNIGVSFYNVKDSAKAERYFRKALEINSKSDLRHELYLNYCNLSEIYCDKGDFKTALNFALKAMENIDDSTQPEEFYSTQSQIGNIYRKMNNKEMAIVYLDNAFRNQIRSGNDLYLIQTCILLADYWSQYSRPDSVEKYLEIGMKFANSARHTEMTNQLLRREAALAETRGDFQKASRLRQRVVEITDSMSIVEDKNRMDQAQQIYDAERTAAAKSLPMANWNPVVVFTIMGLLITVIIIIFAVFIVNKRKKDRAVAAQRRADAEIKVLQEERIARESESKRLIQEELDSKHRQLTTVTLEKLKKSQQLSKIDVDLKTIIRNINPRDKAMRESLQSLLRDLAALSYDTDWKEFHYYFEKVHPSFYSALAAEFPSLTQKDQRLCALLWLGMNTKDIAALTFREVRSVESSRNRLRKKLGLEAGDNLTEFLRRFAC